MTKSKKTVLHVTSRDLFGKKSKQLRQKGLIPANVYGLQEESEKIELLLSSFNRVIAEQGDTTLLYLQVGSDKEIPTLISEIQYNPITGTPTHVAFKRVNLKVKVTAEIPVETVGTAEIAGATIVLTRNVLEVEALPADLPEVFEVDISSLTQVGQTLHLSDVSYDREKVKVMLSEEELEAPIVLVQEVKEEVVETPAETPEGAADATTPAVEGESAASEEKKE
jgi:large subunit ribosomal protein L25